MDESQQRGFDLGWDYAIFDLSIPEKAPISFCDGYRAAKQRSNHSPKQADMFTRKWLQIRFGALARNKRFSERVTPDYLKKITPLHGKCPVLGTDLTFATGSDTDWSIDRADNDKGYMPGNLIIMSLRANQAKSDRSLSEIKGLAESSRSSHGLTPTQWALMYDLILPAFSLDGGDCTPIEALYGQRIALGMPLSPVASFQVSLARLCQCYWMANDKERKFFGNFMALLANELCITRKQQKSLLRLFIEVRRRAIHISDYWEIWTTRKIQKLHGKFLNEMGATGMRRLSAVQEKYFATENINRFIGF